MNILKWQNNQNLFLITKDQRYTYGDLFVAVASLLQNMPENENIWFQASHHFNSYAKLIALLFQGKRVFLVSSRQFGDEQYRNWVESESLMTFASCIGEDSFVIKKDEINNLSKENWGESKFVIRTSGSSGKKYKLVEHLANHFFSKYRQRGIHFERTLAFSPAESIAGVETLLEVLFLEKTLVSTHGNLAPKAIVDAIINHQIDYFQTTPTYMNLMLISSCVHCLSHSPLKKIAFGSEPSLENVLRAFNIALPHVELVHTYGMSEVGILKTFTHKTDPRFWSLDPAINPSLIKDNVLLVKSPTKMLRYLNATEVSSDLGPQWFYTGDIVEEKDGFLRCLGRGDDLINLAGRKFFPSELEDKLRSLPAIQDVTVLSEPNDFLGSIVILQVVIGENEDEERFRVELKKFIDQNIEKYMHPHKILISREVKLSSRLKKMRKL